MNQYEHVASFGLDPRQVWIDPAGAVRQYSAERVADLSAIYNADGSNRDDGQSFIYDASKRLRASGERWRVWRMVDPAFDPEEKLSIQADGDIVERDQGMNPWLLGAIVLAAPLAVVALPGVIAGSTAGAAGTAGSATAAASTGVASTVGVAVSTGAGIGLSVWQQHQQDEQRDAAIQQQRIEQIRQQQIAQQGGGLLGTNPTMTIAIAIGAIVVVALLARS